MYSKYGHTMHSKMVIKFCLFFSQITRTVILLNVKIVFDWISFMTYNPAAPVLSSQ